MGSTVSVEGGAARRSDLPAKLVRYASASLAGTVVGEATLLTGAVALEWPAVAANVVAVTAGAVPNYLINRYWTWGKRGRNRLFAEVLPFWAMTLAGLALSTLLVALADRRWGTPLALSAAHLGAFGSLWVLKFLALERVLFRVSAPG